MAIMPRAAEKILETVLFGVRPGHPQILLLAAGVAAAISLLASWHPVRTAGREDLRATLHESGE